MPFTKEDKIQIKNLFELKGYKLGIRVFQKKQQEALLWQRDRAMHLSGEIL